jgi:hypothetical protein
MAELLQQLVTERMERRPDAIALVMNDELRKALSRVLPNYMLPTRWACLDRLPQKGARSRTIP